MMEKFKIKFQYGITNKIQINNCQNESLNLIPSNFIQLNKINFIKSIQYDIKDI